MGIAVEIIADIIDSLTAVIFVAKCHNMKLKTDSHWIISLLVLAFFSVLFTFISSFSSLLTVVSFIILFCQSFSYRDSSLVKKIILPLLIMLIIILSSSLSAYLFSVLTSKDLNELLEYGHSMRYFLLLSQKLLMIIVCIVASRFFKKDVHYRMCDLIVYLVSPVITVMLLYLFAVIELNYDIERYNLTILLCVFGLAVVNLLSLITFIRSSEAFYIKHEYEMLEQQISSEQKNYADMEAMYDKLQTMRHDFREQLGYLRELADTGNEKVKDYIDELERKADKGYRFFKTHNRSIDYVLSTKAEENPESVFLVTGEIGKMKNITDPELAALIGNMLQNAVEATARCEDKQIELRFEIRGGYQNITCKNALNEEVLTLNPELKTTKKDKSLHGFGVKSMKQTVASAEGFIEFYEEAGHFFVHCAIPLDSMEEQAAIR